MKPKSADPVTVARLREDCVRNRTTTNRDSCYPLRVQLVRNRTPQPPGPPPSRQIYLHTTLPTIQPGTEYRKPGTGTSSGVDLSHLQPAAIVSPLYSILNWDPNRDPDPDPKGGNNNSDDDHREDPADPWTL